MVVYSAALTVGRVLIPFAFKRMAIWFFAVELTLNLYFFKK